MPGKFGLGEIASAHILVYAGEEWNRFCLEAEQFVPAVREFAGSQAER
jgi:hypothetical protein